MRQFLIGWLVGTIILVSYTLGYLTLGLADIHADTPVPVWMARILYLGTHASVRRFAESGQNPLPESDETLATGAKLYLNDCVGCHGERGKPPSEFGLTFFPPAPQFSMVGTRFSDTELFSIAKHGIRRTGMAAQGPSYTDQQLWTIVAFVRQMPNVRPSIMKEMQQGAPN